MLMEIMQTQTKNGGDFHMNDAGKTIASMTYVFAGEDKFILDHTVVSPDYEGKGLGRKLVEAAVNWAREMNYKIVPLCPYANSVFKKTPDYGDVWYK